MFAAALGAALLVAGWHPVHLVSGKASGHVPRNVGKLILVTDPQGGVPDPGSTPGDGSRPILVALGTGRAFAKLASVVERWGAAAMVDGDQPFAELVATLDRLLRSPPAARDVTRLVARLRQREAEAQRVSTLTRRELQVLGGLLVGRSAAEIAAANHIAMPTVRSHIRAVLTKLGVSSQVAAIALATRSCRERVLLDQLRGFHQF